MNANARVLFITRNFPPLTGGMERLNHRAYQALREAYQVALCVPEGAAVHAIAGDRCSEIPVAPLSRFLVGCQWQTYRSARRFRPQVVYGGSGLVAPAVLMAAQVAGARTVCFLHGLDIVANHPIYRWVFLPAIRRMDRVLVNSSHTAGLAEDAGVQPKRIEIVHPGVDLPDWGARVAARRRFRERFSVGDRPLLLAAGRLTQRKGLAEFVRHALPGIQRRIPDVKLLVIGGEAINALKHRSGVAEGIQQAITEAKLGDHVSLCGTVDDSCLSDAYFAADALVFPVLDLPGDVEGFGMVAVEAAAHGLPTIGFSVGGVPDAVFEGKSGFLAAPGDYERLGELVCGVVRRQGAYPHPPTPYSCHAHAQAFSWDNFGVRLRYVVGEVSFEAKQSQV